MQHQKRSLLSLILMCLAALVLAAGCGSGGSGGSSYVPGGGSVTGDPSKYAKVIFSFPDIASSEAKMLRSVPEGTRFISIYGSNSKGDVLYGPSEFRAVNTLTLPDVPVATTVFFLQFRDSRHEILSLYATDKLTLKADSTTQVTVNNWEDERHAPESMDVTIETPSIAAGYSTQCQAKINYGNGAVEAATELVDWKSSDTSVAAVNNSDSKGLVKGTAPGSADITAEIADLAEPVAVTVTDAILESLKITTPEPYVFMLSVYQFKAQASFSDGTAKDVTNEVAWSTDNQSIAEIDETGLAFAVREGQAIITATASNGLTDTTALSISDTADIRSISIKRTDSHAESTPLGFTASYKAIAKVSSLMKEYDVTDQVKWITENEATGAFSSKIPGLYETQGCETGDTVISCVFEETDIKSKNTLNLSVTDAKVTGIKVFGVIDGNETKNPYILSNRENIQFIAKADLSDGTKMVVEPSSDLVWSVDPADNIAADDNGVVTPAEGSQFTPQQYTAKATYNYTYQPTGKSETFEAKTFLNIADAVQVNSITLEAVDPAATAEGISLPVGHTAKFKATAYVSTMNRAFDVTDQVTWSDVSAAGTMDAGLFTAETAGSSADVIATLTLSDIGGTEHTVESEAIKVTVTDAILESVAIDQNAPQIINSNNDLVFTATATYSDGSAAALDPASLPDGASITWASADTSVAEIDETTGAVTPKADAFGQTEITVAYTEGDVTANDATMLSTYDSMAVTELTIDTVPAGVTECANGYTVQFQAIAKIGTKDMEIDVTKQVEWNNDEIIPSIGWINEYGVFKATTVGNANIKATLTLADYSGAEHTVESDPVSFTVTDRVLKSIIIAYSTDGNTTVIYDKAPQILNNNTDLVFTAIGLFSEGTEQVLTSADGLAWSSSDTGIAAIDPDTGAVTPVTTAWGQTEITAAATNSEGEEITASMTLSTVDAMSVTDVTLSVDNGQTTCAQGYTAQFRVTATVGTEGMTFDVTSQAQFENIDGIGTIDEHGLFTGTTVGNASVKATFTARDYSGTEVNVESNAIDFEVTDAVLESITITSVAYGDKAPQILNTDSTLVFTATGHFSYGDDQELTGVTWASSAEDIATIGADGAVTPKADAFGQTEITATYGEASASIMLSTYDALSVTDLTLSADNDVTSVANGYTAQLRAIATIGTTGMTFDVTDQVTFNGIDDIGTIDEHGLFTATTVGRAAVTATYSFAGLSGETTDYDSNELELEVTDAVLEAITITSENFGDKDPQILNTDYTLAFTATGRFSDGTELDLTNVTWASSQEDIAIIDEDGAVIPRADAFGQTEITATSGEISASIMLSTYDALSVTDLTLAADNDVTSVANGYTVQLRAVATIGTTGMTFDVTDQVIFNGIADIGTIDGHGLFTATTVGNATITATYSFAGLSGAADYDSNEIELEVTEAELKSIIITSADSTTDFGEDAPQILNDNTSLVFTATGVFSDGSELALDNVSWGSSDTGIADIDADGAVTPVSTAWGQTKITATSEDGSLTAHIMLSTADAMAVTDVTVTVDGDLASIAKGMNAQFRAAATIGTAAVTYDVTDKVTWEGITDLGTIDEYGFFTAETPGGPVDVTATYREVTSDPVSFEVTDAIVTSIEISPAGAFIANTETQQFTAKAILSDGTEIDPLPASNVAWSSSDDSICAINAEGLATPEPDTWGQLIITASYDDPETGDTHEAKTTLSVTALEHSIHMRMIADYVPASLSDDAVTCKPYAKVVYTVPGTAGELSAIIVPVLPDPNDLSQMLFSFPKADDDPVVKSVTLYNKAIGGEETGRRYAFAWFDSPDGVATDPDIETVIDEASNTFAGGTGTESDPYLVANPRQLSNVNDYMTSHFLQVCDIDFEGSTGLKIDHYEKPSSSRIETELPVIVTSSAYAPFYNEGRGWIPIGMENKVAFEGTYNGGGFEIKDLMLHFTADNYDADLMLDGRLVYVGLFSKVKNSVIENLKLADSCCFYVDFYRLPYSTLNNAITIINGFAGNIESSIFTDLHNASDIISYGRGVAGGIAYSINDGQCSLTRCSNSGLIYTYSEHFSVSASGMGAIKYYTLSECYNSGEIVAFGTCGCTYVGGIIVGNANGKGKILNCWNTGNINSGSIDFGMVTGGIIGESGSHQGVTISNCWNSGTITNTSADDEGGSIGGIAGRQYSNSYRLTISNCFYSTDSGLSQGIGSDNGSYDVPDDPAKTKGCTLAQLKNQTSITISSTRSGYLNALLNNGESVWSVNTKEDNELAPGVLKGFSVFSWQL